MTAVSLTIEWVRGWNGGSPQTFHLQYGINKHERPDDDPNGDGHYSIRLAAEESTRYTVSLYATNSKGSSSVKTATATTNREL